MRAGLTVAVAGIGLSGLTASYPLTWLAIALSLIGVAAFHPEAACATRAASSDSQQTMSAFSVGGNADFAASPLFVTAVLAATGTRGTRALAGPALITGLTLYLTLRRSHHRAVRGQPGNPLARARDGMGSPCPPRR